ncbi:hypothetical protein SCP_0410650 [Sparassis crispa]|uniref:Uncharacterized protein n=1 Tax=Sparassis crispa TaxID=139825 RepID=A0A401GKJ7_9APHY|nr:hypothetical protein SCP_0410650 [Sparassis crispa]GBE82680.1 hypothetical protein SCP_0410650 [Sparassis crispa]
MKHKWTTDAIQQWTNRRDEYRQRKNLPPLTDLRDSLDPKDQQAYRTALTTERTILLKRLDAHATETMSWPYGAPFSGVLYLPLNFRQTHGTTKLGFRQGDDLNRIVFEFYNEEVQKNYPGPNFIAQDGLRPKRYEYLGPMPFVVGYQLSEAAGEASIEWWDRYLQLKWINDGTWRNEVDFDDNVQGWVSKSRGDYSRNLDMFEYTGLDT